MSKVYTTIQGDIWDLISYKEYGSDKFSHILLNSNRNLVEIIIFDAGTKVTIPDLSVEDEAINIPAWRK